MHTGPETCQGFDSTVLTDSSGFRLVPAQFYWKNQESGGSGPIILENLGIGGSTGLTPFSFLKHCSTLEKLNEKTHHIDYCLGIAKETCNFSFAISNG